MCISFDFRHCLAALLLLIIISPVEAITFKTHQMNVNEIDRETASTRQMVTNALANTISRIKEAQKQGDLKNAQRLINLSKQLVATFNLFLKGQENKKTASFINFYSMHEPEPLGSAFCDNTVTPRLNIGDNCLLTFSFIDSTNGLPFDISPIDIGSVVFEARLNPELAEVFSIVGSSSDIDSNFSIPFLVTDFDPLIRAIPFDLAGNPIFLEGVDGFNVAIGLASITQTDLTIPEPTALSLLIIGGIVLYGYRNFDKKL